MPTIEKSVLARHSGKDSIKYIYPITSSDCVLCDIENKVTMDDKFNEIDRKINGFDGKINGVEQKLINVEQKLNINENGDDIVEEKLNAVENEIKKLKEEMENMTFEALSIKSFKANPSYVELGNKIKSITFNFEFNRLPKSIQIKIASNSYEVNNSSSSITISDLDIKSNTVCSLIAYDNKNNCVTSEININVNRRYFYGAAAKFNTLLDLTSVIKNSKNMELSVNAGDGEYVYFCCPINKVNDKVTFNVGGFEGGFVLAGLTYMDTTYNNSGFTINNTGNLLPLTEENIKFSNATNKEEYTTTQTYAVYKSENVGLGNISFKVS